MLNNLYANVKIDGLWLDMNEASNFCTGYCKREQAPSDSVLSKLKYIPSDRDLDKKSIAVDAYHYGGIKELDVHSLFGIEEVAASHNFF